MPKVTLLNGSKTSALNLLCLFTEVSLWHPMWLPSATHPSSIEAVSKSRNLVFSECCFPLQSVVNDFHGCRPPSLLDWFSNCYINWFFCPPLLSYPGEPCPEALVVCCSERPVCFLCLVSLQTQPVCPTSREWMYANRMDTLSLNSSLPLTKQRTVCEPREFF